MALLTQPDGAAVSIPHMGCMPYGLRIQTYDYPTFTRFNPSYGLHALRASFCVPSSAPLDSFNPSYGLHALRAYPDARVAVANARFNPSYGLHALRAEPGLPGCEPGLLQVSIPHMGCMPYGRLWAWPTSRPVGCFNPSYGLHALRAFYCRSTATDLR